MNKKSHSFLLIATASFLAAAGLFVYVLYAIQQQGIQYTESKRLIGEHAAKDSSLNSVQSLLASTKDDRENIKNLFIEENKTISFISEIEKNAKLVEVTLVTNELSILPSATDPNGITSPALLVVGFNFSGSEFAVRRFLTLLENMPYHKKITQVTFGKSDSNIWNASITMQLTLQYD